MRRKLIISAFLITLASGCADPVKYTLSQQYTQMRPRTVAVLPVAWKDSENKDSKDVSYFFRTASYNKLTSLNYRPVPLEEIDGKYAKAGNAISTKEPKEIANLLGAESVLYIRVKSWDTDKFITYRAHKIEAEFDLYSATGQKLWHASYISKDSDVKLDKPPMEYALLKAYEPRVERFVDTVFSTLPQADSQKKGETFYQWLP